MSPDLCVFICNRIERRVIRCNVVAYNGHVSNVSFTCSTRFKISLFFHYFAFGAAGGTELPRTSASLPGLSDSDGDSKEESSPVFEGNEE